jgi:hypothetical protein
VTPGPRRAAGTRVARVVAALLYAATLALGARELVCRRAWERAEDPASRSDAASAVLPDADVEAGGAGPDAATRALALRPRDPRLLVMAARARLTADDVEAARLVARAAEVAPYAGEITGFFVPTLFERGEAAARAAADGEERARRAERAKDAGAAALREESLRQREAARAAFGAIVELDRLIAPKAPGRRAISDRVEAARQWLLDLSDGR